MDEQLEPTVTTIKLDVPVTWLWKAVKQCKTIDNVNTLLDGEEADQARQSNQFPFLRVAINRAAHLFAENKQEFIQAVESELALFFSDTSSEIPADLEALIFLLYVTKHETTPQPGDMTLIDQYFDLLADTVTTLLSNKKSLYYTRLLKICGLDARQQVIGYETIEDFHHEKWRLLYSVLALEIDGTSGADLLDIALDALDDDEEASIINAIRTIRRSFPERTVPIPDMISDLVHALTLAPTDFNDLLGLVGQLKAETEDDATIKIYLTEWIQGCFDIVQNLQDSFAAYAASALNVDPDDLVAIFNGCTPYLCTAHVLAQLQDFYPDLEVPGIVHWTEHNIGLWTWLIDGGTIDGRMVMDSEFAAPIIYLLVQIGGKNPLQSLNGRLKGARNKGGAKQLISQLKPSTTPGSKGGQQKGGQKKGGSQKTPLLHTNICHALLMRKYRFQALNHMMWREVHFMDPVIGDTLCELRPAFLIECDDIVQNALSSRQGWRGLVQAYNTNHDTCPFDETVIGHPHLLLGKASESVGYITLCHTLSQPWWMLSAMTHPTT